MSKKKFRGIQGGLTNYGDEGFAAYLRRSFAQSMGYSRSILNRPVVGITNTASDLNSCHRNIPELIEAVKRGVLISGGLPLVFPTISLGEPYLHPTSLMFRNLMSIDTEEMITAQPLDSVVLISGCDKTVPAQLMGAISANLPAIHLATGPMLTSRLEGERIGACTDCRRFWADFRSGTINKQQINRVETQLATTAGTCAVMGTASTMACLTEVLGLSLPGTASIPAVHADRLRAAEASGARAVSLAESTLSPKSIITSDSIGNAIRVLLALGGSTNAVLHLTAIAGRLGIRVTLDQLNKLSESTPVLVNLKPTGDHYMEDFFSAGGMSALLREMRPLLNLDCTSVAGETLLDRLNRESEIFVDRKIIRSLTKPFESVGGIVALQGNIAPRGCILKRSAASPSLFESKGRAVVFDSLDDLAKRIDSGALDVKPNDFLILRNAGPKSEAGMPEAGYLPIPQKLARQGVKDMVRISDCRMSGSAYGTVILHVTPDAASGGPLALVKNGDEISLSVANRRIDLLVDKHELKRRKKLVSPKTPSISRGYRRLYYSHVQQADFGADFDFLSEKIET